jgi:hypothetical protein
MNLIYVLFFSLSLTVSAQIDFSIDNGSVIWQKVYDTPITSESAVKMLHDGPITNIEQHDGYLTGEIENLSLDSKGAGMKLMTTPFYISGSNYDAKVRIEIKDGRYRVSISNIILTQKTNAGIFKLGETYSLEEMVVMRGKFKKAFVKKHAQVFTFTFDKIFTPSISSPEEW